MQTALLYFCLGFWTFCNASLLCLADFSLVDRLRFPAIAMDRIRGIIESSGLAPDTTVPLVKALLLGERTALPAGVVSAFRLSGASHILALSGLHMGIIYLLVSKGLSVFGNAPATRYMRSATVVLFCLFYTLMTGCGPSLVRAFLFIVLNEVRKLLPHRHGSPASVLCTALIFQLLLAPDNIKSLGFQLSYLAVTGIVLLYPSLKTWLPQKLNRGAARLIWNSAALSLSCQVFTAPLVFLRFGTFPKYFLLTNLLALPLTTALVACSIANIIASAAGLELPPLHFLTDLLASFLLQSLEIISTL